MFPLIMAVCGAAGAVAGAVITHAANEKDRQAIKQYEKINAELINKRNELEKRYYELSDRSKQQINDLNLKLAQSELEKDTLYLAIRLQNELIALMDKIERNPCLDILVEFKKAIALTNHVLKELGENLVPISQDYFSRNLVLVDRTHQYTQEQLFDFMTILMNPEQEIIDSILGEVQNQISQKLSLSSENLAKLNQQETAKTEAIESNKEILKQKIKKLVEKGEQYFGNEQYEQALICFDEILSLEANHDFSIYYQSQIYSVYNDINKALLLINKAIEINYSEGIYYYQKSLCLLDLNEQKEALKAINIAISLEPNEDIFLYQKSNLLTSLENHVQALIFIDHAINKNSSEFLYLVHKGVVLYYLNKYDEALKFLDLALEIKIDYDDAWYWRGLVLFNTKMLFIFDRKDDALESFEKAIIINPNEAEYWYWKSRCLVDLFKDKEALKAIKKAISIEPNNEEYLAFSETISV